MAYCRECGAYIAEGLTTCPACGKSLKPEKKKDDAWDIYEDNGYKGGAAAYRQRHAQQQAQQEEQQRVQQEQAARRQQAYREEFRAEEWKRAKAEPTRQTPAAPELSGNARLMGALAYLSWFIILPFLTSREDEFVRFHLNQGLILLIAGFLLNFLLGGYGSLITLCLRGYGLAGALTGRKLKIPVIGEIKLI